MANVVAGLNPFRPTFGLEPLVLVGRDGMLTELVSYLQAGPFSPGFTTIITGQRGSGKTVALSELRDAAVSDGAIALNVSASRPGLDEQIARKTAEAISRTETLEGLVPGNSFALTEAKFGGLFSVGWSRVRANEKQPLPTRSIELLLPLAEHAAISNLVVLLTVDELHAGDRPDLRRLANDIQDITRIHQLPLAFVGAALPEFKYTALQDRKMTFFHRCRKIDLPHLTLNDARRGLLDTILKAGGDIDTDALNIAAEAIGVLPYTLQVIGYHAWNLASAPACRVDIKSCERAVRVAQEEAMRDLCLPAWHDLGLAEQEFLGAVNALGGAAFPADVARRLRQKSSRVLANTKRRLEISGHLIDTHDGKLKLSGILDQRTLSRIIGNESVYDVSCADGSGGALTTMPEKPIRRKGPRCNEWMPRAKAKCVRPSGHNGPHRSRI